MGSASTVKSPARPAAWLACIVGVAGLTVLGVFLLNRYLYLTYVTESAPQQHLRLVSWNVGKLYLPWESRAADRDIDHLAMVIRSLKPHLVTLQEIRDPAQLGRLLTALGPGWRGKVPEDAYDRRAALLVRLPARFVELPTSTGRTAQAALVRLQKTDITVVSIHLDAFDAQRRLRQAEEIVAGAKRMGARALLLSGDFNFDPAIAAKESIDQQLYRFLLRELADAGIEAGATTVFSRRLDYVFHSDRLTSVSARVPRRHRINTMDHDPLVVELKLR